MVLRNAFENLATESKQDELRGLLDARYAGLKTPVTADVTAAGDTVVHTPSAGKRIVVWWVQAVNDPDSAASPKIVVSLDGPGELYRSYAISHWEPFVGDADADLVVTLDGPGAVAFTAHITEIDAP